MDTHGVHHVPPIPLNLLDDIPEFHESIMLVGGPYPPALGECGTQRTCAPRGPPLAGATSSARPR